jgi:hypothetical protein
MTTLFFGAFFVPVVSKSPRKASTSIDPSF